MNRVNLVGRITAKPELRYTTSQLPFARFSVAINRTFSNNQGEREADFINIVVWRKQAENVCNYLDKGSLVGIDGRIQTGSFTDKDGNKKYTTEVVADNVEFLESRGQRDRVQSSPSETTSSSPYDFQDKDNSISVADDPFADFGDSVQLDDADLD